VLAHVNPVYESLPLFEDEARPSTSYNNLKGNAETERMKRTLKKELLWLRKWESISEA
jgi:hypothetical protein